MYIYNPENFNPADFFDEIALVHSLNDDVRLFLHIIIATQSKYNKAGNEWVPLHALTLRKQVALLGTRTECIRERLISKGVIECDKIYVVDTKCYNFRLTEKYRNQNVVRHYIKLNAKRERILTERQGLLETQNLNEDHQYFLAHNQIWNCVKSLTIDYNEAKKVLIEENENLIQRSYALEKIHHQDFFFHVDERGRVYHNVTSLWSKFRKFLYYDKKKLVNVDIRNSQPLFFAIKLKEDNIQSLLYYSDAQTSLRELEHDVKDYITLVQQGDLYDSLMSEFGYTNRNHFKKKFFAEIFYSEADKSSVLSQKFKTLFPNVYKVICEEKKEDYRKLPLDMQRIEADLIIGNVGMRLAKEGIPFITIHDSMMVLPEHVQLVKESIEDAFRRWDLKPTINL